MPSSKSSIMWICLFRRDFPACLPLRGVNAGFHIRECSLAPHRRANESMFFSTAFPPRWASLLAVVISLSLAVRALMSAMMYRWICKCIGHKRCRTTWMCGHPQGSSIVAPAATAGRASRQVILARPGGIAPGRKAGPAPRSFPGARRRRRVLVNKGKPCVEIREWRARDLPKSALP